MDVKNMTLAEFLLARYDEWAEAFYAAIEPPPGYRPRPETDWEVQEARRGLADLDSKRRIVELHVATELAVATIAPLDDVIGDAISQSALAVTTGVLQLLALPYADHPGYRQEWKP